MLIKRADDQAAQLAQLEHSARSGGPQAKLAQKELHQRRAGIRGESQAAYLIDFDFAASPNWAVIHDLRLEHRGRVAQIDHLLINRRLDVYVLETKSFSGVKITDDGEFLRWNAYKRNFEGMASPLEQNHRHIQVLKEVTDGLPLPERLGIRLQPTFHAYVLVDASARIDRSKRFDSSRVIKSDQLKRTIHNNLEGEGPLLALARATKLIAADTVQAVARRLAALHLPLRATPAISAPPQAPPQPPIQRPITVAATPRRIEPPSSPGYPLGTPSATLRVREGPAPPVVTAPPVCKHCERTAGKILYGKYGYYLRCDACQKNTAIRFTCLSGHNPRLRKERDLFYRECAECGTRSIVFCNPGEREPR